VAEKTKYDPLEAAKVTGKTQAKDEATLARKDWSPPPVEAALPPPPPATPKTREASPAEAPPEAPLREVYEVVEAKMVSLGGGNMHRFKVGTIIDPEGFGGEEGVARLGLKLRKVTVA